MKEQTFSSVMRADFSMRLSNRRNKRAFLLFFLISLAVSIGLHFIIIEVNEEALFSSFAESLTAGGIFFVFLLSFFAISSIAREIADGTLSLSLRLVPNRKRLFISRLVFWPVLTSGLYILFSLIGTPFREKNVSLVRYILDDVLYGALTWALVVLMLVFITGIFRTGALSVLVSVALFIFLPIIFALASLFLFNHAQLIETINSFTPMGAMNYIGTLSGVGGTVKVGMFIREWFVFLAWLALLGFGAWKRFQRESTVSA